MKKFACICLAFIMLMLIAFPASALDISEGQDDSIFESDIFFAEPMNTQSGIIGGVEVNYVAISDTVVDNSVYKIDLRYKSSSVVPISFMTADSDSIYSNQGFVEAPNYTVINAASTIYNETMTVYVNIDMEGGSSAEGETLYVYWPADADFSVFYAELTNIGNVVGNGGVSMVKGLAESESQALRYYFNYNTVSGNEIIINGESYAVLSRGFLFANGGNGGLEDASVTRETAKNNSKIIDMNTTDLSKSWAFKQVGGVDNLTYSTYVTNFKSENGTYNQSQKLYVKGYVEVQIGTQTAIFYSTITNYTVKDIADYYWYHNEGNFASGNEVPEDKRTVTLDGVERQLVWNQEFNTNGVLEGLSTKTTTMNDDTGVIKVSEREENLCVKDGNLVMNVTDNKDGTFTTSKSLTTNGIMSFKYGYVEMRAKLPFYMYSWPSFWMQPDKNLQQSQYIGEIDIVEVYYDTRLFDFVLHKWYNGFDAVASTKKEHIFDSNAVASEYHTYGLEWTPEYLQLYVDGVKSVRMDITEDGEYSQEALGMDCFHDYYYLCLNNWIQINYADSIDLSTQEFTYYVDYIRLYQTPDTEYIVEY